MKSTSTENKTYQRPKKFTKRELDKAGVNLADNYNLRLECQECGQEWFPNLRRGGKLMRGYWKCPNGCNSNIV